MNIFYVETDPIIAAKSLVDKHVIKMILESAQLLSTAHRVLDGQEKTEKSNTGRNVKRFIINDSRDNILYQSTHINHPSAVWCRQSKQNYNWLLEHFFALMDEYTYRYGKVHKCFGAVSSFLIDLPNNLKNNNWTKMPSCMDEQYIISDDPIINYRNYYKFGKVSLHSWKNRNQPEWI
jgi:hypothetical protein